MFEKGEYEFKPGDRVALDKRKYHYYYFVGVVKSYNPKKKKYKVYFPTWSDGITLNLSKSQLVKR